MYSLINSGLCNTERHLFLLWFCVRTKRHCKARCYEEHKVLFVLRSLSAHMARPDVLLPSCFMSGSVRYIEDLHIQSFLCQLHLDE